MKTDIPEYVEQKAVVTPSYRDAMFIARRYGWQRHEWKHVSRRFDLYGHRFGRAYVYRQYDFEPRSMAAALLVDLERLMDLHHGSAQDRVVYLTAEDVD